ncbi:MAG: hypothetical protein JXA87_02335 [Thermoleophilia bacterium]|nr:hypothetical protein [Thermoleophilia bacterium]
MTDYLKLDSTRISFGEYWRWKPGPAFLTLGGSKLFRLRFPTEVLIPAAARIDIVEPLVQSPDLVAALDEPIRVCQERGYESSFWYTTPTLGTIVGLGAALLGADGLTVAAAVAGQTRDGRNREVHLGLASRLLGGRYLVTGDGGSLFDPAPEVDPQRLRGRSYAELLDAHAGWVKSRRPEVAGARDVRELVRELEQLEIDANVKRGIYVPASAEDVAEMTRKQNAG